MTGPRLLLAGLLMVGLAVIPRVEQLVPYLLAGGYFLQGPYMVFEGATTTAVRSCQRDVGLPETGDVNRDLLRRIGVDAILAFGRC